LFPNIELFHPFKGTIINLYIVRPVVRAINNNISIQSSTNIFINTVVDKTT